MTKYGPFGIAWNRDYLVAKGASPVFYIATDSPAATQPVVTREEYFNRMISAWELAIQQKFVDPIQTSLQDLQPSEGQDKPRTLSPQQAAKALEALHQMQHFFGLTEFIEHHVFCFMKCFQAGLAPDDPSNYYMEREWRVIGNVSFDLASVRRILNPSAFAARFRDDFPSYAGQMSFSEAA